MFDIGRLRLVVRDTPETSSFSFVGVRRCAEDGLLELWLPQGFVSFPKNSYADTTKVFFSLYRVLRRYAETRELHSNREGQTRDPLGYNSDEGKQHDLLEGPEHLTFSRIARLERVMGDFTEALMRSLVARSFPRPPRTLEDLHHHLHSAVFSDDHTFFLPETRQTTVGLGIIQTDLIELASYIYREILIWTYGPSSVPVHIAQAAAVFKEAHLAQAAGLFSEESFNDVLRALRIQLQVVQRRTVYRDEDYWRIFEAVEAFLYGDINEGSSSGDEWGVTDFHPVWEAMCHAAVEDFMNEAGQTVLFADKSPRINRFAGGNPFVLSWGQSTRQLAPDLVSRSKLNIQRIRRENLDIRVHRSAKSFAGLTVKLIPDGSNRLYTALRRIVEGMPGVRLQDLPSTSFRTIKDMAPITLEKINHEFDDYIKKMYADSEDGVFVIDFKYMPPSAYTTKFLSGKVQSDVIKSLTYELALSGCPAVLGERLVNQFVIPAYMPEAHAKSRYLVLDAKAKLNGYIDGDINSIVTNAKIDVIALNFMRAVENYAPLSEMN